MDRALHTSSRTIFDLRLGDVEWYRSCNNASPDYDHQPDCLNPKPIAQSVSTGRSFDGTRVCAESIPQTPGAVNLQRASRVYEHLTATIQRIYSGYMKTMINVKADTKVKKKAQQVARDLGLPLGTIVNRLLRDFIAEQRIVFQRPEVPNTETRKVIEQVEKDWAAGNRKAFSPAFDDVKDAITWLHR